MLHGHTETLFAQVWTLKDAIAWSVNDVLVLLGELLDNVAIGDHEFFAWDNDLLVDVFDEWLYKWSSNFLNSLLEPDIVMQELPFACQDSEIDSKIEVIAINNLNQTILDFLGNIKHSGQVHDSLLMSTALADGSNHKILVEIP